MKFFWSRIKESLPPVYCKFNISFQLNCKWQVCKISNKMHFLLQSLKHDCLLNILLKFFQRRFRKNIHISYNQDLPIIWHYYEIIFSTRNYHFHITDPLNLIYLLIYNNLAQKQFRLRMHICWTNENAERIM